MVEMIQIYWPQFLLAFGTYIVATASPGPATLAIMGTAMRAGRSAGLSLAAGVISGSVFWGSLAAFGLGGLLARFEGAFEIMRLLGGCYLLWLAWKSFQSARKGLHADAAVAGFNKRETGHGTFYRRGLAIHLTNPKAVLSWAAIFTLALPAEAPAILPVVILLGCFLLGLVIFGGYALVFSTPVMVGVYARAKSWIETALGGLFTAAGLRLLITD
ncbi:LysE family translocator [Aestuariispira insulae]|uniref:Threonine/homoserine/homoserine lactone efflux protein n=1 Tax=Aestuariispira insulae TaxID=1461337 RepID=A0A3D9HRF8_9PROT|nr:LysE family translocator [Aestuariispira insulae]RED52039.1 threonine/homoserine/homoserine lactone efflux protein [Aestuariispira insulae]